MTARARVARVFPNRVELEIVDQPRCRGCNGACMWRWTPASNIPVQTSVTLRTGQLVDVAMRRDQVLRAALVLHGLPWAGLVLGAAVSVWAGAGDLGVLACAAAGLLAGLGVARELERRFCPEPALLPGIEA